MHDPTALIRSQLSGRSLDNIRFEARRQIDRIRADGDLVGADFLAKRIAGHGPADENVTTSPCVECGEQWPCPSIAEVFGSVDYA